MRQPSIEEQSLSDIGRALGKAPASIFGFLNASGGTSVQVMSGRRTATSTRRARMAPATKKQYPRNW
jgi:hypothetical protein